jgi:tetratricopeptide (TPR) repeat protein
MGLGLLSGLLGIVAMSLGVEAAATPEPARDIERALGQARGSSGLLVAFVVGSSADEAWAGRIIRGPEWLCSSQRHQHIVLRADQSPWVAARFAARALPLLLVLDGEGKEVGRIQGEQSADVLARRLRSMVTAVERFRESGEPLEEDASDPEAFYWLGTYRWNQGDHFLAAACFRRLCDLASRGAPVDGEVHAAGLRHLGEHALDRGEYAEAEGFFRRSLERARDVNSARGAALGLSLSLRRLGRLPEAVAVLEGTLASGRASWLDDQVLFALGYLHRELREHALSRKYFQECAAQFPESIHGERARRCISAEEAIHEGPPTPAP